MSRKIVLFIVQVLVIANVVLAAEPVVHVTVQPSWQSATRVNFAWVEIELTSDSGIVPVGAVEILLEWDVSPAGIPTAVSSTAPSTDLVAAEPTTRPTLELLNAEPLGNWMVAGFLPDPDGINDDITDGQALYTLLAPPGWPIGQPIATEGGMPVLRLKFKVQDSGYVWVRPSAGVYGGTRVWAYGTPNLELTGNNNDSALAHLCCTCG